MAHGIRVKFGLWAFTNFQKSRKILTLLTFGCSGDDVIEMEETLVVQWIKTKIQWKNILSVQFNITLHQTRNAKVLHCFNIFIFTIVEASFDFTGGCLLPSIE